MSAGEDAADRAVTAETPVKQVMEMLRDGAGTLAVTEGAARIGLIRATDLLARLLDPRGAS
jgi:glycine betaine/proline transport system ATP-binding protein